jgi:hypothetical protein
VGNRKRGSYDGSSALGQLLADSKGLPGCHSTKRPALYALADSFDMLGFGGLFFHGLRPATGLRARAFQGDRGAKTAANELKLVGPVEVSAVRQAHPLGPGPYILCIRGTNSLTGTHAFAVFFKNNDYVTTRTAVMIDNCEAQPFTPLGTGPFPEAVKPLPLKQ